MALQRDERVDVRIGKWGGGRHWEFEARHLGQDAHGTWLAADVGCHLVRPDHEFRSAFDWVMLLAPGAPWVASFYDHPDQPLATYVDVTTPPVWDGTTVSMVDLDLDVVLFRDGRLELDDEDEFAGHQASLGYPPEVVDLAERAAKDLLEAVGARRAPFDGTAAHWLATARTARVGGAATY